MDTSKFIYKPEAVVPKTAAEKKAAPKVVIQPFSDLGFSPELLANLEARGFTSPSPIQAQIIPQAMQGFDVLGLAETGSGKTAAFLLPLIEKILKNPREQILVLAPTRELANQINDELRLFTRNMTIFSVVCVGGMPIFKQISFLRKMNHFVIGTPGRIEDLAKRGVIRFGNFSTIVLDEVDYMMDIGFIDAVKRILGEIPKVRQSLFFSATMPVAIKNLCATFLNDPAVVDITTGGSTKQVEQDIIVVKRGDDKSEIVAQILAKEGTGRTMIFCDTKRETEELSYNLQTNGVSADFLNGDLEQRLRSKILKKFKDGEIQALVATDVAARGIDVKDITHVINFSAPKTHEDYIHRIGRAGRAGNTGFAFTLIDEHQLGHRNEGGNGGGYGDRPRSSGRVQQSRPRGFGPSSRGPRSSSSEGRASSSSRGGYSSGGDRSGSRGGFGGRRSDR